MGDSIERPEVHALILWGIASADTMSGKMNVGEYPDAKFTAKRHNYPDVKNQVVPGSGRLMLS